MFEDPGFVGAILDARLREIVADIVAKRTDIARRKLVLFLEAAPGNIQALEILGTLLMNEGDHERAEKLLGQTLKAAPQQTSLRIRYAVALLNQQKFREAAPHLQTALEQAPDDPLVLSNYGWLLAVLGRDRQAIEIYERLRDPKFRTAIDPTQLYIGLAVLYQRQNLHDRQIALLDPLLAETSGRHVNHRLFLNLFRAYLETGKPDEARRVLARLETLLPEGHPGPVLAAAGLQAAGGDPAAAERTLTAALGTFPDLRSSIRVELARLHLSRKYYRRARDSYVAAAEAAEPEDRPAILGEFSSRFAAADRRRDVVPVLERFATAGAGTPQLSLLLAENLHNIGRVEDSLALIDRLLAADPDFAQAWFLKAVVLRGRTRVADARAAMRRSVDVAPDNPAAWQLLADLAHDTDGDKAMYAVLKEGLERNPTDPHLLLGVASIGYSEGELAFAAATFDRLLARYPDDPRALTNAGLIALDRGDPPERARALLERAVRRAPNTPAVADTWAWYLHRAGKSAEAIALLHRVAGALPRDGGVQYHLGIAYLDTGEAGRGRAALRKALALGVPRHYRDDIVRRLSAAKQ